MDFNQVRYFLALSDTLNFTRAAERCHISQPALTQAIKRMENELGGDLILRDGRHTELTELGKSLRTYFEQIDQARQMLRSTAIAVTSGEVAELNIGVMCTLGPRILANFLNQFQLQHPKITLILHDVVLQSIPDLLLSGAIDGAFCSRHEMSHAALRYVHLYEEDMVVAFAEGHEFNNLDTVPLKDISKHRYVDRLHCEFRQDFLDYFRKEGLDLDVVFRSQREDWIQSMIREDVGVCVLPEYSLLKPELPHRKVIEPSISRVVEFAIADNARSTASLELLMNHIGNFDWATT